MKFWRTSKYGAVPTAIDGERFDSKKESKDWAALKLRERIGEISGLQRQVKIPLNAEGGERVGVYVADFVYLDRRLGGRRVIADSKGFRTPLYRWKARHVKAQYGVEILEL